MTDETVFLDILVKGIHQARAAMAPEEGVEMYCPRCGEHTRVTYPEAVAFFLGGVHSFIARIVLLFGRSDLIIGRWRNVEPT